MKKQQRKTESGDEMRPEYDFSKLKLIGRGIYAERFRRGTNLAVVERDRRANGDHAEVDDLRPEYDVGNTRIVRRGTARKRAGKGR